MNTINKKPTLIDVPLLIIFFARPNLLEKVFEQVRIARPSKLFLYQDGARENRDDDISNIKLCREIVENIDWECEVHKLYQDKNYGCDPSEFIAIKWVFEHVDRAIILEDDDIPSQSFFPFCKELLERYYIDERVNMICGMNQLEEYDHTTSSYFFTKSGSITGWASWKRVIDTWEEHLDFLEDKYAKNMLKAIMGKKSFNKFIKVCRNHKMSGRAHYESIFGAASLLNHRLNIVPKVNMISNIGIDNNATHGTSSLKTMPKGIRGIFFMRTHDIEFPLIHPKYIAEDIDYKKRVDKLMGHNHLLVRLYRTCESIIYRLISGEISSITKGLKNRIAKMNNVNQ